MIRRARVALLVIALGGLLTASPVAAAAWSAPFDLAAPGTLDRLPTQLAVAPSGAQAAGFSVTDVNMPGSAQAYLAQRTPGGSVGAVRAVSGAREILALAYSGRGLELLTGTSPARLDCCSAVTAGRVNGGTLTGTQTLVAGLTGTTLARLVTLAHGRQLAAVATGRGVWVAQSRPGGGFAATHRLTGAADAPQALSAAALDGENSVVAWTAASGPAGFADPRSIFYALGSRRGAPHRAQALLRAGAGHRIDELAVAGRGRHGTVAWIDGAFDRRGAYHSQVRATEIAAHPAVRDFAPAGGTASGLSLVADAAGGQALVYKACRADGGCTVRTTTRGASAPFGRVASLGAIDAAQTPSVSISSNGRVIVGWTRDGHPVATVGSAGGGFGAIRSLSPTVYAYDVAVADGPRSGIVAWTQGTLNPSVVASAYR